ncbi:MAG: transglutaminase-like domain-containing protein [Candidatus Hodarchaeota archaeon]
MRKIIKYFILVLVVGFALIVYENFSLLRNSIFSIVKVETKQTLEEQRDYLKGDPFKIQLWINENIVGKSDGGLQFAQLPEETFEKRTGDCEDYAILAKYFLEVRYEEIHIVVWEGKIKEDSNQYEKHKDHLVGHAVCMFKIRNGWGILDNNGFVMIKGTLEDAVRYDCELRYVEVKNAYTARFFHYAYRKLKKII